MKHMLVAGCRGRKKEGETSLIGASMGARTKECLRAKVTAILAKKPDFVEWRADHFKVFSNTAAALEAAVASRRPVDFELGNEACLAQSARGSAHANDIHPVIFDHSAGCMQGIEVPADCFLDPERKGANLAMGSMMLHDRADALTLMVVPARADENAHLPLVSMVGRAAGSSEAHGRPPVRVVPELCGCRSLRGGADPDRRPGHGARHLAPFAQRRDARRSRFALGNAAPISTKVCP